MNELMNYWMMVLSRNKMATNLVQTVHPKHQEVMASDHTPPHNPKTEKEKRVTFP